ncbi:MAG: ABC transporter permease [Candidatus Zixiibacteriota bacterium]|jgi:ABC-type antimicrobial peptide transport system permease subunit
MIPINYTVRNIVKHKITSALTILGVSLVVFVFAGSMMLSQGLKATLVATGSDENVVVIRKSSQTEVQSILNLEQAQLVSTTPEIARGSDGAALFTNEIYVLISLNKRSDGSAANVVVRGVTPQSLALRPNIRIVEGRMWQNAGSEIIAGKSAAERFEGCGLGERVRFGAREWTVVGIFDAQASGFDSEIWGDIDQMMDAFRRPVYSSLTFRMADTTQFAAMKARLENDRRLPVEVLREKEYYANQSRTITTFLGITGTVISLIFSLGAIVGAMITMYAAVANRTKEIGTLRALGFGRMSILLVFFIESVFISFAGGVLGLGAAYFLRFVRVSTTNWDTFSEIAFNFAISPDIVFSALIFAVVMGMVGGFLPAVRAARLKIVESLRAV